MEAIFSRSNLKPDDGFLPYRLLEVFKKTGYGFTNIVVAQAGLKPVLHPEFFFLVVKLEALHQGVGLCQFF